MCGESWERSLKMKTRELGSIPLFQVVLQERIIRYCIPELKIKYRVKLGSSY